MQTRPVLAQQDQLTGFAAVGSYATEGLVYLACAHVIEGGLVMKLQVVGVGLSQGLRERLYGALGNKPRIGDGSLALLVDVGARGV
jgi:hypothetical protein